MWSMGAGFAALYTAYAGLVVVLLPAQIQNLDAAAKESNLALVTMTSSIVTLFAQPIIGAISDRTRGRLGRRTPWMLFGAVGATLSLLAISHATTLLWLTLMWVAVQVLLNVIQAPLTAVMADRVAGLAEVAGRVGDADVERTRELREAVYRTASADLLEQQPRTGDLRLISRTVAGKQVTPVLEELGRAVWRGNVDQVLATVAHQACVLLGGPDHRRVRACMDTQCTRLFVDHSRSGSRRWCDKQSCGGRANAAAYRRRRSQPSPR
jgi:predicted RNA-binding Zn ribbon-like protein